MELKAGRGAVFGTTSMRTEDDMLRRGIPLFGFVVTALLASLAAQPSVQAGTITLVSTGPSQAQPGQPATFDFDWMLHPTIDIGHAGVTFTANTGDGSVVQHAGRFLALSDADSFADDRGSAPSTVNPATVETVQVHVLPLPSGGLLLLTALAPLVTVGWARRQRDGCSPSQ
jgi:hypothetical protein